MTTLKRLRAAAIRLAELQHLALHSALAVTPHQLDALDAALDEIGTDETPKPGLWKLKPEQIWDPEMVRADGRRVSAWRFFQNTFATIPYNKRPFCHELRQNPATRVFYDAMCEKVSRNGARGKKPSSIAELFPMDPAARGGHLFKSERKRSRNTSRVGEPQ